MDVLKKIGGLMVIAFAAMSATLLPSANAAIITLTGGDPGEGFTPLIPVYAYHLYNDQATSDPGPFTMQGITFQSLDKNTPPAGFSFSGAPLSYFAPQTPTSIASPTTNDTALEGINTNGLVYFEHEETDQNDPPALFTMGNLTPGSDYQVDVFVLNSTYRANPQDEDFTFNGGQDNHFTAALNTYYDVREDVIANGSSQIVLGLTTAGIFADGNDFPNINAVSVTLTPEPASAGLLLLGFLGFGRRTTRNRRRAQR